MLLLPHKNFSEQGNNDQRQSFEKYLVLLIESKSITQLASLAYQVGDYDIQRVVAQTLFGQQKAQQLEELLNTLTNNIVELTIQEYTEIELDTPSVSQPKQRFIFQGTAPYVHAMVAIYQYDILKKYYQAVIPSATQVDLTQTKKQLKNRITQTITVLISQVLFQYENSGKQQRKEITELDIFSVFRWLLIDYNVGIKAFNAFFKPTLSVLSDLLQMKADELHEERSPQLVNILTHLHRGLIQYRPNAKNDREDNMNKLFTFDNMTFTELRVNTEACFQGEKVIKSYLDNVNCIALQKKESFKKDQLMPTHQLAISPHSAELYEGLFDS